MRHHMLAGAALAAALALSTATSAVARSSEEAEVFAAVDSFRKAMMTADGRTLTAMAAPSLRFGHSNGMVQSQAEFVKSVVTRKEIFRKIVLTDRTVSVAGQTAVARHTFHADILFEGKPLLVTLSALEVWRKQAGKWQLLARQAFTPKPPVPVAANPARPAASTAKARPSVAAAPKSASPKSAATKVVAAKPVTGRLVTLSGKPSR